MRRRRKTPFVIFAMWLCFGVVGFLFGYYFAPQRSGEKPLHIVEEPNQVIDIDEENDHKDSTHEADDVEDDRTVSSYDIVVGANTNMIFRTMYAQCEKADEVVTTPLEDMVGLKEREFKEFVAEHYQDWQVIEFSGDKIVLHQNKEQYCPNHFLVKEDGGYIAIYRFNEEGEPYLVEKTQIPISNLPKVDQERLKNGWPLPSREEVDQLLEDYIG